MGARTDIIPIERIQSQIFLVRGENVMLDSALAVLYDVETRALVQAVKRNPNRFPKDFMFQLTEEEFAALRSQSVTSKSSGRGGRRYPPYAFTEQGIAMLSSVLHSDRAIQVNIEIMRAFVRLRHLLASEAELAGRIAAMETRYDAQFEIVFDALRDLTALPESSTTRPIGFAPAEDQ